MNRIWIVTALLLSTMAACDWDQRRGKGRYGKGSWGGNTVKDWRVLVEAVDVGVGSVARELVTHGTLESEAMADITPEAGGVVQEIRVEEGDSVRAGSILAVLSNPSLEAGSARARVELSQAQRRFEQAQTLHARGAISDTEFQEAEDGFAIAKASHREATGSAGFTRLTSPIDGTVSIRDVRLGELAGGAQRAFQVVDLNRLRVIVNLSEGDLEYLSIGQPVVLAGTYDDKATSTGEILRISPVVDETSGTVRVTIAVHTDDKTGGRLRPGQFVEVRIEVDRHSDVMTIPRRAVYWQDGAPVAWRITDKPPAEENASRGKWSNRGNGDDKDDWFKNLFKNAQEKKESSDPWEGVPRRMVERVSLSLGYTDSVNAEITAGLARGDTIVNIGGENLRPDAEVKLPGDPNPKRPERGDKKQDDEEGEDE